MGHRSWIEPEAVADLWHETQPIDDFGEGVTFLLADAANDDVRNPFSTRSSSATLIIAFSTSFRHTYYGVISLPSSIFNRTLQTVVERLFDNLKGLSKLKDNGYGLSRWDVDGRTAARVDGVTRTADTGQLRVPEPPHCLATVPVPWRQTDDQLTPRGRPSVFRGRSRTGGRRDAPGQLGFALTDRRPRSLTTARRHRVGGVHPDWAIHRGSTVVQVLARALRNARRTPALFDN